MPSERSPRENASKASFGIPGLDAILGGGLPRDEMHLVQGSGGTGKTTMSLQFLLAGVRAGEPGLYVTLSQTEGGLARIASSHGWSLDNVVVHELSPGTVADRIAANQTVLHTADVELGEITRELRELVEAVKPRRAVFDSIGVISLLAGSATRYHREIVLLRQFLAGYGCTALFIGDWAEGDEQEHDASANSEFHSLTASVIHLEQSAPDYGDVRRTLRVIKMRGVPFAGGRHNFKIRTGGLEVYPRLDTTSVSYDTFERLPSGIAPLDTLLGGGLEHGTACLFVGPSGVGKSTVAAVFARSAAQRGEHAAIFLFDERPETFEARSAGVGIPLREQMEAGTLEIDLVDTSQISAGEFANSIRDSVEQKGSKLIVIDSLTGYFNAMDNSRMLAVQMHELLNYASRRGVLTLLLITQQGFMTVGDTPTVDISYLSDTILVLRMFEADGVIRRCIAAAKKRQGEHETTIRELFISSKGVTIAHEPLHGFESIFDGTKSRAGQ